MSAQLHAPGRLKTFYGLNVRFTFSWEEDMNVIELCVFAVLAAPTSARHLPPGTEAASRER